MSQMGSTGPDDMLGDLDNSEYGQSKNATVMGPFFRKSCENHFRINVTGLAQLMGEETVFEISTLHSVLWPTPRISQATKILRVKQEEEELELAAITPGTVDQEVSLTISAEKGIPACISHKAAIGHVIKQHNLNLVNGV